MTIFENKNDKFKPNVEVLLTKDECNYNKIVHLFFIDTTSYRT